MTESNSQQLNLKLDSFDGPLDVLENLIRERKMDILHLDVAALADQYVKYINENINSIGIDVASDYLVMATYLLELKSKKIIPVDGFGEKSDFDEERLLLIQRLVEYRKYKDTLPKFFQKQVDREKFIGKNPDDITEFSTEIPIIEKLPGSVDPAKLINALNGAINRYRFSQIAKHGLSVKELSVDIVKVDILEYLSKNENFTFEQFIESRHNVSLQYIVTVFLALLEMAKYRQIIIEQRDAVISVSKCNSNIGIDVDETQENK